MSINNSYFSRNNTLISNSLTNTGRNPVIELFYGNGNIVEPFGFSRFIFDLDLSLLKQKYNDGMINPLCNQNNITHTLRMTNTSFFDKELLNDTTSEGRRRAISFDLILLRIPKVSGTTGSLQTWDSGVGYDYYDFGITNLNDRSFSNRPTNWFERTTINDWSHPGIYDNTNSLTGMTGLNFSALTPVAYQHFEFGNEDIEFDMTSEINGVLAGTIQTSGYIIAFYPQVENISGMSENYSVGFFSPHTQTFYEPYLETVYDDLILDDRNAFYAGNNNSLYLYVYENGNAISFDTNPIVDIVDINGNIVLPYTNLPTCLVTKGVYKVDVDGLTSDSVPCLYYDVWKGLSVNGVPIDPAENEFVLLKKNGNFKIGTLTENPKIYGFSFNGIKQNEKILNTDLRKVNVTIKRAYSSKDVLENIDAYYRIYVNEGGNTEVQVQDWTQINRTPDAYYFMFETKDKIPNEYFVDIKVNSDRNVDTYKRVLQFQIVNKK